MKPEYPIKTRLKPEDYRTETGILHIPQQDPLNQILKLIVTRFVFMRLIQTISQKANQQRYHHVNVPINPHVTISHFAISVSNVVKAITAKGNKIANTILMSSKPFLIAVLTDDVTGYFTST